jgi:hypothetical protein
MQSRMKTPAALLASILASIQSVSLPIGHY